jgi:hypothetical protein
MSAAVAPTGFEKVLQNGVLSGKSDPALDAKDRVWAVKAAARTSTA